VLLHQGEFYPLFLLFILVGLAVNVPSIRMGSQSLDAEPIGESFHAAMLQILMLPRSILPADAPRKFLIQ